jgi:transposase
MMRRKNERFTDDADRVAKDIKRRTRRRFSAEEKIRILLAGLGGEDSIAELCRQEGISQSQYYSWSKEFMEAGKKCLAGDTMLQASHA